MLALNEGNSWSSNKCLHFSKRAIPFNLHFALVICDCKKIKLPRHSLGTDNACKLFVLICFNLALL
jgi:hypothetical protein